jgi:hypothetical protein
MGYYDYQSGLIFRHMNQEGGWDEHCRRCRNFILKALELFSPEKISILGSGWLLELPLAEMAEKAKKICLIDIVHPPEVIKQSAAFKNVELLELDVTGGLIEEVWKITAKLPFFRNLKSLESLTIPDFKPEDDPGLVISLNILTQLESLLVLYLEKKSVLSEDETDRFRAAIQKKHIDFLIKHNSVLVSDVAEIFTDRSGNTKRVSTIMTEIPEGALHENWTWNFDLKNADNFNSTSVMEVVLSENRFSK